MLLTQPTCIPESSVCLSPLLRQAKLCTLGNMCACIHQTYKHPRCWNKQTPACQSPGQKACINSWSVACKRRIPCCRVASARDDQAGTDVAALKRELLQVVSRLNASIAAAPEDAAALLSCVQRLARVNPTPQPETSPLMNGRWVLLYTSNAPGAAAAGSSQPADTQQQLLLQAISPFQAVSGALYKVFYTYLPVLAGSATGRRGSITAPSSLMPGMPATMDRSMPGNDAPVQGSSSEQVLLRSRGNFQTFDLSAGTVVNEARFELLGSAASITVNGTVQVVPGATPGTSRLKAMFTSFSLCVDAQQRLSLPLAVPNLLQGGALAGPVGYVDTCYLDDELRISAGDKGSLFITMRAGTTA